MTSGLSSIREARWLPSLSRRVAHKHDKARDKHFRLVRVSGDIHDSVTHHCAAAEALRAGLETSCDNNTPSCWLSW